MSSIEIIIGCMFSGKSTELNRRASRYKAIGKNVLVINSILDTRGDGIKLHSNVDVHATKTEHLMSMCVHPLFSEADVIAVDESQFFTDLHSFCLECEKVGKILIIAGLDGDSNRKPFGEIMRCIPLCDTVVKLTALDMISRDGTLAIFSKRICWDDDVINVGGADKYVAVSRENYLK